MLLLGMGMRLLLFRRLARGEGMGCSVGLLMGLIEERFIGLNCGI